MRRGCVVLLVVAVSQGRRQAARALMLVLGCAVTVALSSWVTRLAPPRECGHWRTIGIVR